LQPGVDVKIAGVNWTEAGIQHVMNGEMTLTHGGHFLAGGWAMVMLYDIVQRGDFNSRIEVRFPMAAITPINAPDYVKHFGSQQWSRIDFKSFSLTHAKKQKEYQFTLDKLTQSLRQPLQP